MKDLEQITEYWKRIDLQLQKCGATLKLMSDVTKVDYGMIKVWRSTQRMPNAKALVAISKFLGVSIDYLLSGEQKENDKEQLKPCYQYLVPYINNADETGIALVERALGVSKNRGGVAEASSDSTHSMVG